MPDSKRQRISDNAVHDRLYDMMVELQAFEQKHDMSIHARTAVQTGAYALHMMCVGIVAAAEKVNADG